jgi:hypothetical protein
MCFWVGLEILRLVNKKAFFEILNGFYLISKKSRAAPLKKFLRNLAYRVSKEADFKNPKTEKLIF